MKRGPDAQAKQVRRAWPFLHSIDEKGRVTKTLPVKQPKRPVQQLPDALF